MELLLPPEAFLIPAPYYGAITQHVYLYGNVRLVCVYLDSRVRPVCHGTFEVASRLPSTVSHFKTERGNSLEML